MSKKITIGNRAIGKSEPVFIIAEISANHNQSYEKAVELVKKVKIAGADAVKFQTYRGDTITLDCDNEYFQINQGTIWDGTTLYQLYEKAFTPWEWQPKLKKTAEKTGLICFSSAFDLSSVEFLEKMNVPAYKIASFEINDIPLIRSIAKLGKPIIISTGIAKKKDIKLALETCKEEGNDQIILLKCTSAYPTPYEDIHLHTMADMGKRFKTVVGLSDHSLGDHVAIAAVALGAKVIEKHVIIKRDEGGPDAAFSMEIEEFEQMVKSIRNLEKALGTVSYELTERQKKSREHSRSLFVVEDVKKGDSFTAENVKSIRPNFGMHTKYYNDILGKAANADIKKGTPLDWGFIE